MNNPDPRASDVLWACVEAGFHVGSRGGDFLGYVDRQPDGQYMAFDARSRMIGAFATLDQATGAVSGPTADAASAAVDSTGEGLTGVILR